MSGFRIITDSANGAASDYLPQILEELGAEVIATHREPNGVNINNNCGSTHIESLQERVLAEGADCGIANDGDADRCLFVDEKEDRSWMGSNLHAYQFPAYEEGRPSEP